MNRRDFLRGLLVAVPAVVVVPEIVLDALEESPIIPPTAFTKDIPYEGPIVVREFQAAGAGTATESLPALVSISRYGQDYSLVNLPLNAYGGFVRWISPPGEKLVLGDFPRFGIWRSTPHVHAAAVLQLPGVNKYQILEAL